MKWNKKSLVIISIILAFLFYSTSVKDRKLRNRIKAEKMAVCLQAQLYDCNVIETHHNVCFEQSYRAELKIKSFRPEEYDRCIQAKIKPLP